MRANLFAKINKLRLTFHIAYYYRLQSKRFSIMPMALRTLWTLRTLRTLKKAFENPKVFSFEDNHFDVFFQTDAVFGHSVLGVVNEQ